MTTNSIRGGKNRTVLERVKATGDVFMAWPDEPWLQDGAAVRVSLFGFDDGTQQEHRLNGQLVQIINADLSSKVDLTQALRLPENANRAFTGVAPAGAFDVPGHVARQWLQLPNPDGVDNADVLRPYIGGDDVTGRPLDRWTVDFNERTLEDAQRYRRPMQHVESAVRPVRLQNNERKTREQWWQFKRPAPAMRAAIAGLKGRFLGTSEVSKHRTFVWVDSSVVPSKTLTVIAADDDFTYGVLNSRVHTLWADRMGTSLESRSRYTPKTTFDTFPFPLSSESSAITRAAVYLEQARTYLRDVQELTLTASYNALNSYRATGTEALVGIATLADAHAQLDLAVAAAYGWDWPLSDDEILARLLALNLERAGRAPAPA